MFLHELCIATWASCTYMFIQCNAFTILYCAGFYLEFWSGGKILKMMVGWGCIHRVQFCIGGSGGMPMSPDFFLNFDPSESGSEAF